jgi:hypothetical protein
MDPLKIFTSSMHELLGITILTLCEVFDDMSPSTPPQYIFKGLAFRLPKSWERQFSENALRLEEWWHVVVHSMKRENGNSK